MTAVRIDGKAIAAARKEGIKRRVDALRERGITPGLAVVLAGDDPASATYVASKERACRALGMHSQLVRLAADVTDAQLRSEIDRLNADPTIHGILVQLPLPAHLDAQAVLRSISPDKDVDGFHPVNVGKLALGEDAFLPCTPHGILVLLREYGLSLEGKHVVVIGRSNIVGKPVALLALRENATVTICHSRTVDLKSIVQTADVVIAAVGKPDWIDGSYLKDGAVVIDVGINRMADGRLTGDVDYASASEKAAAITPVPGGVGPMTIAMLMENTCLSAERAAPAR